MPLRAQSHRLEDISEQRFRALLPSAWVCRRKEKDYGIDLEVEIFEEDGRATGLQFLVQLKATSQVAKQRRLNLKTDHLRYFRSLDIPTMIVRYAEPSDIFFWRWHFNTILPEASQKSYTIAFDDTDRWSDKTCSASRRTIELIRELATYPAQRPLQLKLHADQLPPTQRFAVETGLYNAVAASGGMLVTGPDDRYAAINVIAALGEICIAIDCCASRALATDFADVDSLADDILYSCADLLRRHPLVAQSQAVAAAILERGRPHHDPEVAIGACLALRAHPEALVDLALINGINHADPAGMTLMMALLAGRGSSDGARARERYQRAFLSAVADDPKSAAAVHYSLANLCRSQERFAEAVHHYNFARKGRPAYLNAAYFLGEIANCCFSTGHMEAAAKLYLAARAIDTNPYLSLCCGDALALKGHFAAAKHHFADVLASGKGSIRTEAGLKLYLCEVLDEIGFGRAAARRGEGWLRLRGDGSLMDLTAFDDEMLEDIWRAVDITHPALNHELAERAMARDNPTQSIIHLLIVVLRCSGDMPAWALLIARAFRARREDIIAGALTVLIRLQGRDGYVAVRQLFVTELGAREEIIIALDEMCGIIMRDFDQEEGAPTVFRILGPDGPIELPLA